MYRLGVDAGSASIKMVLADEGGAELKRLYAMHGNDVRGCLDGLLAEVEAATQGEPVAISATGTMSHLLALDEAHVQSDVVALEAGLRKQAPQAPSCISIGASGSIYLKLNPGAQPTVRRNTNCSAGTGSFLQEQSGRLEIPLEEISNEIARAQSVPHLAGRCSVFSKTDIIHHMQEGASVPDLLLGLCFAMVRNYKANILQNEKPALPVALDGGTMRNAGVVRAVRELFDLGDEDVILDGNADFYRAIGCAALASREASLPAIRASLRDASTRQEPTQLAPLASYAHAGEDDVSGFFATTPCPPESAHAALGIDIGSASINLVLVSSQGEVLRHAYLRNTGNPLEILEPALEQFKAETPATVTIDHIAITGSGREYVGQRIGADFVINEITAQAAGAAASNPEVDTIFEIGGQDSKYMSLDGGQVRDFEMNKVCAAGTGTFLEEQVRKLGISMEDFVARALASESPCVLGDRCTVFIESGVTSALAEGTPLEDICAGLAYAIASNYLHRVVNMKPVGDRIAVQGGIAFNLAVVCAFRSLTGKDVQRSQFFSVTGALGAALLSFDAKELAFDAERNRALNRELLAATEASYLDGFDANAPLDPSRKTVGIPRVVFLNKMFPLFKTMFTKLGYNVVLSPRTNAEIVRRAREHCTEETCFPIKLIYGHISWLLDQGVDYIILPRLVSVVHKGSRARVNYSCMYMQTSPLLMDQAFHLKERGVKFISPKLSLNFSKKYMIGALLTVSRTIGVFPPRLVPAALAGVRALFAHSDRLETLATDYMDTAEPVFVLMSRVYNIIDPALGMGVEKHLDAMGCRVIHLEHLEASFMNVDREYGNLYWPFGQHILTGFQIVAKHDNLFPIYITNHGCGPDTAIQHYIKRMMVGKPYLHLEVDEHSSKIGVITRLEAFLYEVAQYRASQQPGADGSAPLKLNVAGCQGHHGDHQGDCGGACATNWEEVLNRALESADGATTAGESAEQPIKMVPELGIYTDVLASSLGCGAADDIARPVPHQANFNYAINKEYHSLLVSLEEVVQACEKNPAQTYQLCFPTYEGAEVWGQYGLLIVQELERRGITAELEAPFLEDYLAHPDIDRLFDAVLAAEKACYGAALAAHEEGRHIVMAIGEPLCVYKASIIQSAAEPLSGSCAVVPMPLSEALVLFWGDTDRLNEHPDTLKRLRDKVENARQEMPSFYTPWDQILAVANGNLNMCAGGFGRYRLAKRLLMTKSQVSGILLINSAEENTSIVLRALEGMAFADAGHDASGDAQAASAKLPTCRVDIDYSHGLSEEEARSFLHFLG